MVFFVGYFAIGQTEGDLQLLRLQNTLLGVGVAFAMLGIGLGVVHWAKTLMPDHEMVEDRKPLRKEADREEAAQIVNDVIEESQIKRRPLLRNTLIGAALLAPLPFIVTLRDLDRSDDFGVERMRHSMWDEGVYLVRDPSGTRIRASDLTVGSAMHVIPENLRTISSHGERLSEKAKAVTLVMRLNPEDIETVSPGREDWSYDASSPAPRSAPMWAARWPSTSGTPITCCAPATSPPSTPPTSSRWSSGRPAVRCRSCPSLWTTRLPRRTQRLHRTHRPDLLGARHDRPGG